MSTLTALNPTAVPTVWSEVDAGLEIGESAGNYIGMINYVDGQFVVTNFRGSTVGRFATVAEARHSLSPEAVEARHRKEQLIAAVAGSVSAVTLIVAFSALTMAAS